MHNESEEDKCVQYTTVRNNNSKLRLLAPEMTMLYPNILLNYRSAA